MWAIVAPARRDHHDQEIIALQPRKAFPFLRLPAELRNAIYRLVFLSPTDKKIEGEFTFEDTIEVQRSAELTGQFLSTCRQVYLEGRTILYGENTFSLLVISNHLIARQGWMSYGNINVKPKIDNPNGHAFKAMRRVHVVVDGEQWRFILSRRAIRAFGNFVESLSAVQELRLHFEEATFDIDPRHQIDQTIRDQMGSYLLRYHLRNGFHVDSTPHINVITEWLGHLRNIPHAEVTGMPEDCGNKLAAKWMSSDPPVNNLAAMYKELHGNVAPLEDIKEYFYTAMQAVEDRDWLRFLKVRDVIRRELQEYFNVINDWVHEVDEDMQSGDMEELIGEYDMDEMYNKTNAEDDDIPINYFEDEPEYSPNDLD